MAPKKSDSSVAGNQSSRISIPVTADGQIAWDEMRTGTKERLAALVAQDPDRLMSEGGLVSESTSGGEDDDLTNLGGGITTENVATMLDLMASTGALALKIAGPRFLKHPFLKQVNGKPMPLIIEPEVLAHSFRLTAEQHNELDPRALRLAKKYTKNTPEWVKNHMDLIMLMVMFGKYQMSNIQTAIMAQVKRDFLRIEQAKQKTEAAPSPFKPNGEAKNAPPDDLNPKPEPPAAVV